MITAQPLAYDAPKHLLIVDDDEPLRTRLGKAMERRGYAPLIADSVQNAFALIEAYKPTFAIVDLRIGEGNGLDVVSALNSAVDGARIVILSGYGNIPTAVAAAKAGAVDFLPKPADADDLEKALNAPPNGHPAPPENAMSPDDVRWAHIEHTFINNNRNISQTARQLGMHRRTLQRMLAKKDVHACDDHEIAFKGSANAPLEDANDGAAKVDFVDA